MTDTPTPETPAGGLTTAIEPILLAHGFVVYGTCQCGARCPEYPKHGATAPWHRAHIAAHVAVAVVQARAEGESCPTCVKEGGPYRCCPHCADDPGAHEDGQHDHHDLPCRTCVTDSQARAEDRARIEAFAHDLERDASDPDAEVVDRSTFLMSLARNLRTHAAATGDGDRP